MKELSIEKMEMVSGGGCGPGAAIGFLTFGLGVALIVIVPPAAGAAALASGTSLGLTLGAAIGECVQDHFRVYK